MRPQFILCLTLLSPALVSCGDNTPGPGIDGSVFPSVDAGAPDASVTDASAPDASAPDASAPDASVPDASVPDASVPDASVPDASTADAGVTPVDCSLAAICPPSLSCDASTLTVVDAASAAIARANLVDYVWKGTGFPSSAPSTVVPIAPGASPITLTATNISIERLTIEMPLTLAEGGGLYTAHAYHFRPQGAAAGLVILHQGHDSALDAGGLGLAANALLDRGYAVVMLWMPLLGENTGPVSTHDEMMALESATRSPIQFFVEPVAVALNYLIPQYSYSDINMVGLSGGGWTTHVYAALDPAIRLSFPVAGSLPLDMRIGDAVGDGEQEHPALYNAVSYRDLFVLGGAGPGRAQIQVLNRDDSCCFSGVLYRGYDNLVASAARATEGHFRVYLDTTHTSHQISPHVLDEVILSRLTDNQVYIADVELGSSYEGSTFGEVTRSAGWQTELGGLGGRQDSAPAGNGDVIATWRLSDLPPARYRISAVWGPRADRATNAPFRVLVSGVPITTTFVNQQVDLAPGQSAPLSELDIAGEELTVELSNNADGFVIADSIRVERIEASAGFCQPN